tara:strand:+ start:188 stop:361 length:174 start_codon:yes stop_codon:yes gene_type:complete
MYLLARQWGIQPGEFWAMTLNEWFFEYDQRRERDPSRDYAGSLTQADVNRLQKLLEE